MEKFTEALEAKFKDLNTKFEEAQNTLAELQAKGATKEELKAISLEIEKSGNAIEAFIEANKKKQVEGVVAQFKSFLTEKEGEIKDLYQKGSGSIEFIPKAVADVTTASGTEVGTPDVNWHTNLGGFNLRNDDSLLSLATISSTGTQLYSYTEMLPKEGGYAFVAEGAAKPQIDFKWENRFANPVKAAAYEILTEEAATDIVRMEATAKDYLLKQHNLHKVNAVYFADGTGSSPTGATEYGRAFVAGSMADVFPAGTSNFMDVVNACITDIYTTQAFTDQGHYQPNVVMINPVDFFINLVGAKDDNGLPLYPQAGLFNEVRIGGVRIVPWIKIPAGKIFVADMSVYNVINYVPFSIRIGWINDQLITNKFTMVGESRYFAFVKNLDQAALIYDDISVVQAAITAV